MFFLLMSWRDNTEIKRLPLPIVKPDPIFDTSHCSPTSPSTVRSNLWAQKHWAQLDVAQKQKHQKLRFIADNIKILRDNYEQLCANESE